MNAMFSEKYVKDKLNRLEQINSQKRQKVQQATQAKKPQLSRMEYEKYKKILFEENNKHKDSTKTQPDSNKQEEQKGQTSQSQTGNNNIIPTKDTKEIEKAQDKSKEAESNIPNEDKQQPLISQSNRLPKPGEIIFAPAKRLSSRQDSKSQSSLNSSKISQNIATSPVRQAPERTTTATTTSQAGNKSQTGNNNNNNAMINQKSNQNIQKNNFQQQGQVQYPIRAQSPPNSAHYINNNNNYQQQQFFLSQNIPPNQLVNQSSGQFQRIPDNFLESQIQNGMRPSFQTLPRESHWNQQLISPQAQRYYSPQAPHDSSLNGQYQGTQCLVGSPRDTQLSSCRSDNFIRNPHQHSSSEYRETSPNAVWDNNCLQQSNQLNSCRSQNYQESQQGQQYGYHNPQEQSQQQQQLYSNRSYQQAQQQQQQLTNHNDDQDQQEIQYYYQKQHQEYSPNQQVYQQQQQQFDIDQHQQQQQNQVEQHQQQQQCEDDVLSNLGVSEDVTASEAALEELKNAQETLKLEKEQLQRELVDLHNQSIIIKNKNANNTSNISKKSNTSRSQFYDDNTTKSQRSPKGSVFIEGSFKKQESNRKKHNLFLDMHDGDDGNEEAGRGQDESGSQSFEKKWEDLERDEEEIEKSFSLISERLQMHTRNNNHSQFTRDRERRKSSHGGISQSRMNKNNSSSISSSSNRQKSCGRQDYYKDVSEYDDFDWLDGIEESFSELKTINKTDLMPLVQDIQQHSAKKTYLPTISNASGILGNKVEYQEDAYTKLKNSILSHNISSNNTAAKDTHILASASSKSNGGSSMIGQTEASRSNMHAHQANNNNSFLSFQKKKTNSDTTSLLVDINKSISSNSGDLARSAASPQFGKVSCSQSASRLGQSFLSNDSDGIQSQSQQQQGNTQKTTAFAKGSTVRERYEPINGKVKISSSGHDDDQDRQLNSRYTKADNQRTQKSQDIKWEGEEERRQQEYITQKLAEMGVFEASQSQNGRDGQDRQELLYSETTSSYNPLLLLSGQQENQEQQQQILNNNNFERYFNNNNAGQQEQMKVNEQGMKQQQELNSKLTLKHRREGEHAEEEEEEEELQVSDLNNYNRFKSGLRQNELIENKQKQSQQKQQYLQQQLSDIQEKSTSLQVNKTSSNLEKNIKAKKVEQQTAQNTLNNQHITDLTNTIHDAPSLVGASNTEKYNKFNQILQINMINSPKEAPKQGGLIKDKGQVQPTHQQQHQESDNDSSGDELEQTIKQKLENAAKKRILLNQQTTETATVKGQQQQQQPLQNDSKEQASRYSQEIALPSFCSEIISNQENQNNSNNNNIGNNNNKKNYSIDQLFEKQEKPSKAASNLKPEQDISNSGSTKDKISNIQSKLNDLFNKKSTKNANNNSTSNNHRNMIDPSSGENYQTVEKAANSQPQSRKSNLDLPKQESTDQLLFKSKAQDQRELQVYNSKAFDSEDYEDTANQQHNSHKQQGQELDQQGQQLSRIDRRVIDNLAEEVEMLMKMQNIGQEGDQQQNDWRNYEGGENENYLESESKRAFWPRGQQGQLHEIEEEEDHSVDNSVLEQQQQQQQQQILGQHDQFMRQY